MTGLGEQKSREVRLKATRRQGLDRPMSSRRDERGQTGGGREGKKKKEGE